MLPDDLFGPLDLDEALDHAEDAGEDAVIALLREALTDPRAHGDEQLADYLDPLVEAYRSAGRQREAIDTLRQIADREPNLRGYLTALIADLHAQLGEQDTALNLIKTWQVTQRALAADQRDIDFYAPTALTAAEQAGDLELARSLIADGLRLAAERGDAPVQELMLTAVEMRLFPEKAAEARHTMASRGPDPAARRHRATTQHRPQPAVGRAAYLPAAEYAAAWEQKLLDATTHRAHEDYRRELEQTLRALDAQLDTRVCVVPLDVSGLLAYAEREGKDPASRRTRLEYNDSLHGSGRDVDWPPQRNAPCWCGSARKYKKCCGAPGFLAVELPDPASLVLRIELDDAEPEVWRRITVPSNTPLDQVHQMIQAAMGWQDTHLYAFETDDYTIIDPRSTSPGISADGERIVSIASEPGQQFSYRYDFGDDWRHTVTVEEIRDGSTKNTFEVLDGAGACPPEDCGGAGGYLTLVQALNKPGDPDHDHAVQRLGEDYDPSRYEPPRHGQE